MSKLTTGCVVAVVIIAATVFMFSRAGYGQNRNQTTQAVQCSPFQNTVVVDLPSGEPAPSQIIRVSAGTSVTIEQVSLRIDATPNGFVVPSVAAVTTTVGQTTSAYYLPIPTDSSYVIPSRPLTLAHTGPLHASGGSNITLFIAIDGRYMNGSGRAEWSVGGLSCGA